MRGRERVLAEGIVLNQDKGDQLATVYTLQTDAHAACSPYPGAQRPEHRGVASPGSPPKVPAGQAAGTPSVQYDPMGQGSWKDWYRARAGLVDGIVKNPGVASSGAGVPWKVQAITWQGGHQSIRIEFPRGKVTIQGQGRSRCPKKQSIAGPTASSSAVCIAVHPLRVSRTETSGQSFVHAWKTWPEHTPTSHSSH